MTTAMPIRVATPDSIDIQRTRATRRSCSGLRGFSSSLAGLVMNVTQEQIETVVVADAENGDRLDRLLAQRLAALSRTRLKALILDGAVTIGGRTILDPGHRVNAGEKIEVTVPPPEEPEPKPENIPLNIVYEDDQLIVIDKPSGLVVHPAAGHPTGTLVNALIAHCGDSLSGIGG